MFKVADILVSFYATNILFVWFQLRWPLVLKRLSRHLDYILLIYPVSVRTALYSIFFSFVPAIYIVLKIPCILKRWFKRTIWKNIRITHFSSKRNWQRGNLWSVHLIMDPSNVYSFKANFQLLSYLLYIGSQWQLIQLQIWIRLFVVARLNLAHMLLRPYFSY